MRTFGIIILAQAFTGNAPLHRRTIIAVYRQGLVYTPARRTMIDDHMIFIMRRRAVAIHCIVNIAAGKVSEATPDMTNNHLVRAYIKRIISQTNAVTGSGLSAIVIESLEIFNVDVSEIMPETRNTTVRAPV